MMLTSSRLLPTGLVVLALALQLHAAAPALTPWETPPGWTETRGGAGGRVMRVTTLAADGPGSLREAVAAEGPRVIEFAVAGTIELGGRGLRLTNPFLTIAGETAPSPGITLIHGGIGIVTHDVILRHIRVHVGDGPGSKLIVTHADGLSTGSGAHDVIVDHCSFVWGTDETLSASGPRFQGDTPDEWRKNTSHRITYSHCIVGEGMHEYDSKGTLIHDNATDIALIGNFYASHNDRQPLCKGGVRAAIVNNFIYNPGRRVMQLGYVPGQWKGHELQRVALAIEGNVVRKGPSSAEEMVFLEVWPAYGPCDFYLNDNRFLDAAGKSLPVTVGLRDKTRPRADADPTIAASVGVQYGISPFVAQDGMRRVETPPLWPPRLKARASGETVAWVLANAGARPWDRDEVDRRLVEEAKTGGGKILRISRSEAATPGHKPAPARPRLAVLTDIGGDPDDQQSMIRLMAYANEFDLELLIPSAVRKKHAKDGPVVRPDLIREIVAAYGLVRPNLQRHADHWPTVGELDAIIVPGNPLYGREQIGEGHDSPASAALIARIDAGSPDRPLDVSIWGGQTDLAQALWRVKHERGSEGFAAFAKKLRIFMVGDQDRIASWMKTEFPGLFCIQTASRTVGGERREGAYRGMYVTGDESLTSAAWVEKNVRATGPLGALYPMKTWTVPNPNSCLKEGDTLSWFYFLPDGGNAPGDPARPGWGGRYQLYPDGWYGDLGPETGEDPRLTVSRWRPAFQEDFARRLAWCLPETAVIHP